MMNIWHDIDSRRVTPEKFTAVIEISKGKKNKYELDKETGLLKLDRVLYTSMHYTANYGFIPKTYAEDNDPLDVLVLCSESILPMTIVECYPVGILYMVDGDEKDEKIVAIPVTEPTLSAHKDISDLPPHIFNEMKHFFEVYKLLEDKSTMIQRIGDAAEARACIEKCMGLYNEKFGVKEN